MRMFIDKDDLLDSIIEVTDGWGNVVYCVLEEDIKDAHEAEAIDVDWIVDYVDNCLTEAEASVVKRMVGTWYDEWRAEYTVKKKPTLTEAYTKGYDAGSKAVKTQFVNAVKWMQEELQKRSENGEQEEEHSNSAVQERVEGEA